MIFIINNVVDKGSLDTKIYKLFLSLFLNFIYLPVNRKSVGDKGEKTNAMRGSEWEGMRDGQRERDVPVLAFSLSLSLSVFLLPLPLSIPVSLFLKLSVRLFLSFFLSLSVCLSVCFSLSLSLCLYPSPSPSLFIPFNLSLYFLNKA